MVNVTNKVYNPKTKRFVKKDGAVGKKVIKQLANNRPKQLRLGEVSANSLNEMEPKARNIERALRYARAIAVGKEAKAKKPVFKTVVVENNNRNAKKKLANIIKPNVVKRENSVGSNKTNEVIVNTVSCIDGFKDIKVVSDPVFVPKGDALVIKANYYGEDVFVKVNVDDYEYEADVLKHIMATRSKGLKSSVVHLKKHIKCALPSHVNKINQAIAGKMVPSVMEFDTNWYYNEIVTPYRAEVEKAKVNKIPANKFLEMELILQAMTGMLGNIAFIQQYTRRQEARVAAKKLLNKSNVNNNIKAVGVMVLKNGDVGQNIKKLAEPMLKNANIDVKYLAIGAYEPYVSDDAARAAKKDLLHWCSELSKRGLWHVCAKTRINTMVLSTMENAKTFYEYLGKAAQSKKNKDLDDKIYAILFHVMWGLMEFERKSILHGDLHLNNVLVGKYERVIANSLNGNNIKYLPRTVKMYFGSGLKTVEYKLEQSLPQAKLFDFDRSVIPGKENPVLKDKDFVNKYSFVTRFVKGWDLFFFACNLLSYRHSMHLWWKSLDDFFTSVFDDVPSIAIKCKGQYTPGIQLDKNKIAKESIMIYYFVYKASSNGAKKDMDGKPLVDGKAYTIAFKKGQNAPSIENQEHAEILKYSAASRPMKSNNKTEANKSNTKKNLKMYVQIIKTTPRFRPLIPGQVGRFINSIPDVMTRVFQGVFFDQLSANRVIVPNAQNNNVQNNNRGSGNNTQSNNRGNNTQSSFGSNSGLSNNRGAKKNYGAGAKKNIYGAMNLRPLGPKKAVRLEKINSNDNKINVVNAAMKKLNAQNNANVKLKEDIIAVFASWMKQYDSKLPIKFNKVVYDNVDEIMKFSDMNYNTAIIISYLWYKKVKVDRNAHIVTKILKYLDKNGFFERFKKEKGMEAHTIKNSYNVDGLFGLLSQELYKTDQERQALYERYRHYRTTDKCKYQFVDFMRAVLDIDGVDIKNKKITAFAKEMSFISGFSTLKQFRGEVAKCTKIANNKGNDKPNNKANNKPNNKGNNKPPDRKGKRAVSAAAFGNKSLAGRSKKPSTTPNVNNKVSNIKASNTKNVELKETELKIHNYSMASKVGELKFKASKLNWETSRKRAENWNLNNFKYILESFHNPHENPPTSLKEKNARVEYFMGQMKVFMDMKNRFVDRPWKVLKEKIPGSANSDGAKIIDTLIHLDAMAKVDLFQLFNNFPTDSKYHTVTYIDKQKQHGIDGVKESKANSFNVVTVKYKKANGGDVSIQVYGTGTLVLVGCNVEAECEGVVNEVVKRINFTGAYRESMIVLLDQWLVDNNYQPTRKLPAKLPVPKMHTTNISASFRLNTLVKDFKGLYKLIVTHFASGKVKATNKLDFIEFKKQASNIKFTLTMKDQPKRKIPDRKGEFTEQYPSVSVKITSAGSVEFSGVNPGSIKLVYKVVRMFLASVIKDVGVVVNVKNIKRTNKNNMNSNNMVQEYNLRYIPKLMKKVGCSKARQPTEGSVSIYARVGFMHYLVTGKGSKVYKTFAKNNKDKTEFIKTAAKKHVPEVKAAYEKFKGQIGSLAESTVVIKLECMLNKFQYNIKQDKNRGQLAKEKLDKKTRPIVEALVLNSLDIPAHGECCNPKFPRGPLKMLSRDEYCCYKDRKIPKGARAKNTIAAVNLKGIKVFAKKANKVKVGSEPVKRAIKVSVPRRNVMSVPIKTKKVNNSIAKKRVVKTVKKIAHNNLGGNVVNSNNKSNNKTNSSNNK